jgi:hypothetical protein
MKEKAEQERIETEKVFKEQLQTLKDNLQASSQNALTTMSDAMGQEITSRAEKLNKQYQVLSMAFGRKWIGLAILGAALCLGMAAGGWALTKTWAWRLAGYRNELAQLKQDTQAQRDEQAKIEKYVETLNKSYTELWEKTGGVALMERNGSRYIVAPTGSEGGHSYNGYPAIKLKE